MKEESGNFTSGEEIITFSELVQLAKDKKSVMIVYENKTFKSVTVRPAAFVMNWSAWELSKWKIYKTVKKDETKSPRQRFRRKLLPIIIEEGNVGN